MFILFLVIFIFHKISYAKILVWLLIIKIDQSASIVTMGRCGPKTINHRMRFEFGYNMLVRSKLEILCTENWESLLSSFSSIIPGGTVENFEGVSLINSGLPSPEYNSVFAFDKPVNIEKLIDRIKEQYVTSGLPWRLITLPNIVEDLKPLIEEMKLNLQEVSPGMILDPLPDKTPESSTELNIREVSSLKDLEMFLEVSSLSFGHGLFPDDGEDMNIPLDQIGSSIPGATLYIGLLGKTPVATSLRYKTGNLAGIYFVGTVKEFRRRGYAEAMTWRAIMDGAKEGCVTSCLEATEMGHPLYEHMGFKKVTEYQLYGL